MTKLTTEQADQIIMIDHRIEDLRKYKELIKAEILKRNNEIINIDIEIRKLRIELALIKPEEPKPHKETEEEKIARLEKELAEVKGRLAN